jgi:hypothetical protein
MERKNLMWMIAIVLTMCGFVSANAQSAVHPKAYYDAISYQWTDASGASHTSALTDVATNPYQIVAMLKKVYCDPRVPGSKYTSYSKNGAREREVYYGAVDGGWNISASDVTPPYEEGYTILMVAVKDNLSLVGSDTQQQTGTSGWLFPQPTYGTFSSNFFTTTAQLINYVSNNIASVQLLVDGLRIGEGEHMGTTFNISGNYNRFFMLGKGQSRQKDSWVLSQEQSYANQGYPIIAGERVPFKYMFEQFSPTDGSEGSQITDFYAKMVNGDIYGVIHDCASVIEVEHYFSMAGKNATTQRSLTGLNIFIPDYRLKYWEDNYYIQYTNGQTSGPYLVDGRTMNPYIRTNGTTFRDATYLTANFAQYNPNFSPQVGIYTINLEAQATEAAGAEKTYDVTLDWTSSLNTMANGVVGQDYTIYIVTTDEDGNEVNQELVVVNNDTQYVYQVPQDEHSYTVTYVVHGQPNDGEHDVFVAWSNQASVIIPGWNDFMGLALNHYESDYDRVNQCNYYRNYLYLVNEDAVKGLTRDRVVNNNEDTFTLYRFDTEQPDVMIPAATLNLSANGASGVRYEVTYENQWMRPNYNVPVTTTGNVTVLSGGLLDLSSIMFVDQFNASTELNNHPARYGYMLVLNEATTAKSTNTVEVPVFKITSAIDGFYSLEEVLSDDDAHLTPGVKNANVTMNLSTNTGVYYYSLDRGDNSIPSEAISKLQRRTDGTYEEMLEVLPQYKNQVVNAGEMVTRFDNDIITGGQDDYMAYQPVIWTFGDDRVKNDGENSYGSPMWTTGVGNVGVNISGTRSATVYGEWNDENGEKCVIFNPIFTITGEVPELASVDYEPFMYRVWRLCNDVRGYGRNAATNVPYNNPTADRSADKLIIEEQTGDDLIFVGNENGELSFGAKASTEIEFRVRFYYKKVGNSQLRSNDEPMYYVVEKVLPWSDMPTGVVEMLVPGEVSKTYYNAQGLESDKPFDGVNVVVTRYSDGSVKTTKVVR